MCYNTIGGDKMINNKQVSKATLQRFPIYLKALRKLKAEGYESIMSEELASIISIKSTTIRRDFSFIGSLGKQGYGYSVDYLIETFSAELGLGFDEKIILIGVGNLGKALLNYNKWNNVVGEIVCAFDLQPENVNNTCVPVYHLNDFKDKLPDGCRIAILCISKDIQHTVDFIIEHGIVGIVDFTHEHFTVPKGIVVKPVDVVSSIQELVYETNALKK